MVSVTAAKLTNILDIQTIIQYLNLSCSTILYIPMFTQIGLRVSGNKFCSRLSVCLPAEPL